MRSYKGIYHPLLHKLICLDGTYLSSGYLYDIDANQYSEFNLGFQCNINNDFNACLYDKYSKLFYCESGRTLIANINANQYHKWKTYSMSPMLLNRNGHSILYHDKLSQIIIGGGCDIDLHKTHNDVNISGRTIEIYDLYKDIWKIIDIKTNYMHSNHPSLWYDLFNPFIINIENNDFYSCEFIDIREQKQWHKNYQRKSFLQQFKNQNALVFS